MAVYAFAATNAVLRVGGHAVLARTAVDRVALAVLDVDHVIARAGVDLVAPGLTGRAQAAKGRTSGSFKVRIIDTPVPARVGDNGRVERGSGGPDS